MKKLTTFLLSIATMFLTSISLVAQSSVLTFTTAKAVGEEIKFAVGTIADDGTISIEGAEGSWVNDKTKAYTLTSQTVKISGDIGTFKCKESQLTKIDVKECSSLLVLDVDYNDIESLDVQNNPKLEKISFRGNKVKSIDVSKCTNLTWLACSQNELTELNTASNSKLDWLNCSGNKLTAIDVQHNPILTGLLCSNMELETIDVSPCPKLQRLLCQNNKLSALDITHNEELNELYCFGNQLSEIDLTKNSMLKMLNCSMNKLTALDLSANTKLTALHCFSNEITSLDVSACTALKFFFCSGNKIKGAAMDKLIASLRTITKEDGNGTFGVIDNTQTPDKNVCTKEQVATALERGWIAQERQGKKWVDYAGGEDTALQDITMSKPEPVAIYDIYGNRLAQPIQGFNIFQYEDGTTEKIVIY